MNVSVCVAGFWARDRDNSELQFNCLFNKSRGHRPYTSTKRREGINPLESALKPHLYIFNYSNIYRQIEQHFLLAG